MVHLCRNFNVPYIPVLTKSDKLSNSKIAKAINFVLEKMPNSNPISVSSKNISGFDELSKEMLKFTA